MMDVLKWVPLLILVVLILILLIGNIVIVQQSKAYVVERLGAFHSVWGVGEAIEAAGKFASAITSRYRSPIQAPI